MRKCYCIHNSESLSALLGKDVIEELVSVLRSEFVC